MRIDFGGQDPRPQRRHLGIDLGRQVKAGEGQRRIPAGRQRRHLRCLGRRLEADIAVRKPRHRLDIVRIFARRHMEAIGDEPIHRLEPRGSDIPRPGDLHGRRAPRKCRQAIAFGVAREIDQNVDAIARDFGGEAFVRPAGDIAPAGDALAETAADRIVALRAGICREFERGGIQGFDGTDGEVSNGMVAQVRGDEPHA